MYKDPSNPTDDEKLVEECHRRFKECEDRESETRKLWKADLRFANGDPENGWQWDETLRKQRESEKRPCLTVNKVKQHNRQITNDARQNKPSIRVYPVDGGADKETAEVLNGIIRHIEANSNADMAYDLASEFAVDAGLGYWRVTTDYASDDSFDQEIYIKAVPNPLNVYLGKHSEPDGSDAKCGFVFEDIPKEEFEARYPNVDTQGWGDADKEGWANEKTVRVAEYWKIVEEEDILVALPDGKTFKLSEIEDADEQKRYKDDKQYPKRTVKARKCKWYLIAGHTILDKRDWPGKYIPIVRVVGEEREVDGKIDRKGHTRALKDAQRMYNYWSSAGVEYGALQGKQPYMAPVEAIEGHEDVWNNLNTANVPYIPFNHRTEDGEPVPVPQRQMPPVSAPMYMEGMRVASEEMKMASGQYDASMGAKSNETSGKAIEARQDEGDNATFHFIDNKSYAVKYTGRIIMDLIPKVYDTARVIRILGEDGNEDFVQLDPSLEAPYKEEKDLNGAIQRAFNPSVGRYDVTVSVGPSYGTRRREAFAALNEIAARNPQLMAVAGDLVMKAADFPMADDLAKRLEKTIPPELRQDENEAPQIPPQVQQQIQGMGQALQQAEQIIGDLQGKLAKAEAIGPAADLAKRELELTYREKMLKALQDIAILRIELKATQSTNQMTNAANQLGQAAQEAERPTETPEVA